MSAAAILKLQAAGFSAEQVTALAELVDAQAATKADLEAVGHALNQRVDGLERRLDAAESRLNQKIDAVEHGLNSKIDGVELRLELKIGEAKADIRVLKWMMGFILAFQVAIFVKLFMR